MQARESTLTLKPEETSSEVQNRSISDPTKGQMTFKQSLKIWGTVKIDFLFYHQVLSYEERASHVTHPVAKRLLSIMSEKHTNLAFSVDVTSSEQLLKVMKSKTVHAVQQKND